MQLENLQIVDAPEYLAMLPELAPVREMTMQDLARMAFGSAAAQSLDKLLKNRPWVHAIAVIAADSQLHLGG